MNEDEILTYYYEYFQLVFQKKIIILYKSLEPPLVFDISLL